MPANCPGCGEAYGEIAIDLEVAPLRTQPPNGCDNCYVCRDCLKRWAFHYNDPPPLGRCNDCLNALDGREERWYAR